jgi:hypothetical protein
MDFHPLRVKAVLDVASQDPNMRVDRGKLDLILEPLAR